MSLLPADVQQRADAELGAAFRRVQAAVPPGSAFGLEREHHADAPWSAWAEEPDYINWGGATPTEALEALLTALEERS